MVTSPAVRISRGERLNAGEKPGRMESQLAQRGIRLTRQRRVILHVMDTAQRHLDAAEILDRACKIDPHVHAVTVYRTIDLLKTMGLIDELDLLHIRGDRHYYESHGPRDHIHIACLHCGKVREYESSLFEELKNRIEREFDMKISVTRTEIGGYCVACADELAARNATRRK